MAEGDRIARTWIDASGLVVSRNELTQVGPSFLMLWPGRARNDSTGVFQCRCGAFEVFRVGDVYRGTRASCGRCDIAPRVPKKLLRKPPRKGKRQDGLHSEYWVWNGMKARCHNPRVAAYQQYGARGITVCEKWRESFAAFIEDMGPRPSPEYSIDRIDNDGNYEPGNCRWAALDIQANNKRASHTINGKTLGQVSIETGIKVDTLRSRLNRGWSAEKILSTPTSD